MDLHYKLMRQTINIAIVKAIEDMKSDTRRSSRNLLDLGLLFAHSENQKWFFNNAKAIITHPQNSYNKLLYHLTTNVAIETLKMTGLNLGYTSLIYGAKKLRHQQNLTQQQFPWLIIFDATSRKDDGFFRQTEDYIIQGTELGIYSYIYHPQTEEDIIFFSKLALKFTDCLFILQTEPALITARTADGLGQLPNLIVSIAEKGSSSIAENAQARELLQKQRCFYGFHVKYNPSNMQELLSENFIHDAICCGYTFGTYIAANDISPTMREAFYSFICSTRQAAGQPLLVLDWNNDMLHISERIGLPGQYLVINPAGAAYGRNKKTNRAFGCTLLEIIKTVLPHVKA